jgi:hypothetical protein
MRPIFLTIILVAGTGGAALAQEAGCKTITDGMQKVLALPTHIYLTGTAEYQKGKTDNSEMIYSGSAIYLLLNGKWTRSRMSTTDMAKQEQENIQTQKMTCRFLRDETVGGELAAVYTAHTSSDDSKSESTIWVSKSKGLPLKVDTDMDVGGAAGKSHRSQRFEYSNVHPPAGVQ